MALISQSIKNLKGGISQQPDILRFAEQGAEQVNAWSSETEGLQKRPPLLFTKAIGNATALGTAPYVHLINRDEFEQYFAVFTGTDVKVIGMDGTQYTVRGSREYITTAKPREDLRMITVADYTFIINRTVTVKAGTALSNGGTFREKGDALVNVRGGQYGRTLVLTINGTEAAKYEIPDGSQPAHVKNTDAQFLAEELAKQARLVFPTWTFTVGQGYIHIIAPANVTIDSLVTKDGYSDQLINPVTHFAQTFARLPLNAPDNYMVKIVGDTSRTADQYFVVYDATRKVWRETVGWNELVDWTDTTMPWTLIRAADGQFDLKTQDWTNRKSGDDDTNPYPSLVDSQINDVFFFRNRLGFLTGENIVMSRTARYFDFFPASVANLSDDDPIDVAVSHNRVSTLKYAVPFTEELLLWSDEAQFVLGASGVLTSRSVELNLTTQFDVQDLARPYGIGRHIYFASPRATFSAINRYYAVQDVTRVKSSEDATAHVPSYIPNGVFSIHGSSTENYAAVLSSGAPSKVFIYKFLYIEEQVRQQSWSHWDFGDNVTIYAATAIGSQMFLLMSNGAATWLGQVSFTKDTVDIESEPYRIYLDNKVEYQIPATSYNIDTNLTTIDIRQVYGMASSKGTISIVEMDGRISVIPEPTGTWVLNPLIELPGDLSTQVVFVGFNIPFVYEFSKFLIKKTADDGSSATEDIGRLQLRRAWLNYEESGAFTIQVENQSRTFQYEMAGGRLGSNLLRVGRLNVGTGQYKFPVTGNAVFNTVRIVSDTTTPLNVIGCGWEGNYIRRSSGI
ncbi:tail tubular protein B [Pectobacterium phage Jarilo]|uniref:Tail tubular protein B n=1 Tax=Pectobacterium phage Jarilo TaxID=2163634 RepID=A0A2S1GSZ9_9CAUD|nr:tail protein [Pectobacterium phage Jarilo]AWD92517.1 tail tubular protein B [Pectobacterium phage Jarilo]